MCLEGELSELKVFNDLKRVTSDCKPFEKGFFLFVKLVVVCKNI